MLNIGGFLEREKIGNNIWLAFYVYITTLNELESILKNLML
jgi:hypothetical protein